LDRAYRLAGLLLGDAHDAEDAVHDALVRAWQRFPELRDRARFDAWLDRIVVNVCRDRMRRSRRVTFLDIHGHGDVPAPGDTFATFLQRDELTRALTSLDPDLRVVVVLRYWADLSVDDIAARLGVPAGTVKSRLHRAIAALRASLPSSEVTA
jgi:RNA polymerase sigma-70 factor (ECF subfamily)